MNNAASSRTRNARAKINRTAKRSTTSPRMYSPRGTRIRGQRSVRWKISTRPAWRTSRSGLPPTTVRTTPRWSWPATSMSLRPERKPSSTSAISHPGHRWHGWRPGSRRSSTTAVWSWRIAFHRHASTRPGPRLNGEVSTPSGCRSPARSSATVEIHVSISASSMTSRSRPTSAFMRYRTRLPVASWSMRRPSRVRIWPKSRDCSMRNSRDFSKTDRAATSYRES